MKIHSLHPKYLSDNMLDSEHDLVHELFDALSDEDSSLDHPDYFRFNGRRGLLFIRHRKLVEEMNLRGISHATVCDRRFIESEEWDDIEATADEVLEEAGWLKEQGESGRVPLPDPLEVEALLAKNDLTSVIIGKIDKDHLTAYWKVFKFVVMEKSYSRYRSLSDPVQGQGRGSTWVLFDLMMEEALAVDPDERGPAIAYETMWELLEPKANGEEKEAYAMLAGQLKPGKVSLEMREFLARAALRQDCRELTLSGLMTAYVS